jgi:antitoxin component YwqK of YwqJK toxin-antitoxin module
MKKITLILATLLLISCGQSEINLNEISNRNGLAYQVNKTKPFTGKVFSKLENGQILISGSYKDGRKDGEWTNFFRNGQIKKREKFSKDMYNGLVELFLENGQKISTETFNKNELEGISEFYNQNGVLVKKVNYNKGQLDGDYIENYDNNKPKIIATYKNNSITSRYSSFYQNGNKELEYTINNNSYINDYISYNYDGVVKKHYYYTNSNKINKGKWLINYNSNWDEIKEASTYYRLINFDDKGKPKGKVIDYYNNNSIQMEGYYSSIEPDIKNGKFKWYYKDGNLMKSVNFINGKENGLAESYYETTNIGGKNKIHQKVNFNNGELEGKFEYWAGKYQKDLPVIVNYYVAQNMGRGQWWKLEGNCKKGKFDGTFKLWWRYRTNRRNEPYIMPAYLKHVWQNGNLTWNGVNEYFNINGKKLTSDDRTIMLDNVSGR